MLPPRVPASWRPMPCWNKATSRRSKRLLEENLNGESLTPASAEWRESLVALGRLLRVAGRYDEAALRFEEAVKRYGDLPDTWENRYLAADCYHQRAKIEMQKLAQDLVEETKIARMKRIRDFQTAALDRYRQAQEGLLKLQEIKELGPAERRRCGTPASRSPDCSWTLGNMRMPSKHTPWRPIDINTCRSDWMPTSKWRELIAT